jgi:hypothetical protein
VPFSFPKHAATNLLYKMTPLPFTCSDSQEALRLHRYLVLIGLRSHLCHVSDHRLSGIQMSRAHPRRYVETPNHTRESLPPFVNVSG